MPETAEELVDRVYRRLVARNVGGGVDRDKIPAKDFAGRHRSFPIVTESDVADALQSIGRAGPDNYDAAELRRRIVAIARRKGFSVPGQDADSKKAMRNYPDPFGPADHAAAGVGAVHEGASGPGR